MALMLKITGVSTIMRNLKNAHQLQQKKIGRGLVEAGRFLQRESMEIVPVHLANLKASAFTRALSLLHVIVGYTAAYAVYVHENLDAAHGAAFNLKYAKEIAAKAYIPKRGKHAGVPKWKAKSYYFPRGENQQAKFLEHPMRVKRRELLQIIHKAAIR